MNWFGELRAWIGARRRQRVAVDEVLEGEITSRRTLRCAEYLPQVDKVALRQTVCAFAEWAFDLPASEAHHDARPFGLFEHSLEVSEIAVRTACIEDLAPQFGVAAWVIGLFHDVGKLAMVRVSGPGALWNPYIEPLVAFYSRHGRNRCEVEWVSGRCRRDSWNWPTPMLMGRILPGAMAAVMGPTLLTDLLERRTPEVERVAAIAAGADHLAVRQAMRARRSSS